MRLPHSAVAELHRLVEHLVHADSSEAALPVLHFIANPETYITAFIAQCVEHWIAADEQHVESLEAQHQQREKERQFREVVRTLVNAAQYGHLTDSSVVDSIRHLLIGGPLPPAETSPERQQEVVERLYELCSVYSSPGFTMYVDNGRLVHSPEGS